MQTIGYAIQNLYAPCGCSCAYCLLQNCHKTEGVDYFRGKKLAERFVEWNNAKGNGTALSYYGVSYTIEYPELYDNLAFNQSIGAPCGKFLQINGIRMRDEAETDALIKQLSASGVSMIDTTFFGDETYHDAFAGRKGDYRFMLRLASAIAKAGIVCAPSIPVFEDNKHLLDGLFDVLSQMVDPANIHFFLSDYRGHGERIDHLRLTEDGYASLSDTVKKHLNLNRHRTERDWLLRGELPECTRRSLVISLLPDNIDLFERMTCAEIIAYVEALDDAYYASLPSINELAKLYGDPTNTRYYRVRDLAWKWQKRYREEHGITLYDVTDERLCHTIRS